MEAYFAYDDNSREWSLEVQNSEEEILQTWLDVYGRRIL
jgi:hypothetical protein